MPTAALTEDNEDDIGGIADIVGFHIRLAHASVYRHFTETFVDLDLTQKQVSVLWLVDDHPGISQIEVGKVTAGTEPAAPATPHLLRRALIATGLAIVLTALLLWGLTNETLHHYWNR